LELIGEEKLFNSLPSCAKKRATKKLGVKTRWFENLRAGYNKINNLRQLKLFLEERNFPPIIKIEARHAPVLCKTICPEVRNELRK